MKGELKESGKGVLKRTLRGDLKGAVGVAEGGAAGRN
jgi:hypothetical protein